MSDIHTSPSESSESVEGSQSMSKAMLDLQPDTRSRSHVSFACIIGGTLLTIAIGLRFMKGSGYFPPDEKTFSVVEILWMILIGVVALGVEIALIECFANWHLRFDCPHCGKALCSDQPWRCGRCGEDNTPVFFQTGTVVSRCEYCRHAPHTLQCPHCRGTIDFVAQPDRRHPAVFLNVAPVVLPPEQTGETPAEQEARLKQQQEKHEETLQALRRQAEILESQVRCAIAEAKLAQYTRPKDEGEAAIAQLMQEIQGAYRRNQALLKFRKVKAEEIQASGDHTAAEKESLLTELDDLIQEAKAKYL